ncbi:hypothetical protein QYE76_043900 [Lolium multiflorum]|uniref:Uncharacterized protein n=1 Tax=Lolium multiflorum TaxID=4521 RepID=A0AAD8TJM5_LOLMU|nr:hypothetical protein QYE76_043900 [Lolium multiflorum]
MRLTPLRHPRPHQCLRQAQPEGLLRPSRQLHRQAKSPQRPKQSLLRWPSQPAPSPPARSPSRMPAAAIIAGKRPATGRINELTHGGANLGHLLDYAKKWNRADLSAVTLGLGKDKMPAIDPAGPRNTELLGSVEALKTQLSTLQDEKEQLIREHRKALDAQEIASRGLKDQLIQAGLRHDKELKEAKTAAEAKLAEFLEDSTNSSAMLRAELEEESKARKAAKERVALLTAEQKEYKRRVKLFPDSHPHAHKKVRERRIEQSMSNPEAPWDAYDYLVALSARIQHMRAVDRHHADLPDVAIKIFKVLAAGSYHALRIACSWYEDLDLDSFHSLRHGAPTDKDPVLTAKRKDRAYHIAEHAPIRTFIPPPPDVEDYLSDYEEEDIGDEEIEDAGEGDAPPEAGGAPPEAPAACLLFAASVGL